MSQKTVFQVGDLVQLKSGGPVMTVNRIPDRGEKNISCVWFAGSKDQQAYFNPLALQNYTPPEKKK